MSELLIYNTNKFDIDKIISMETDIKNSQFIFPNTKEAHLHLINDKNIEHLLFKSKNNETLGFAILAGLENRNKSIEFRRIVIKEKGKGLGRMAIKVLKKYCFEQLNCHRLWLDVLENNERARHLYITEGFKEEGKLRETVLIDSKYQNLMIMSLLEDEYKKMMINLI